MRTYHPFYSDAAAEFIISISKRKGRKVLDACNQLAVHPFIKSDYSIRDLDGRDLEHISVEGFVIAYWIDHPACQVMIVDVDVAR